jgi:hypothetical protein
VDRRSEAASPCCAHGTQSRKAQYWREPATRKSKIGHLRKRGRPFRESEMHSEDHDYKDYKIQITEYAGGWQAPSIGRMTGCGPWIGKASQYGPPTSWGLLS